MQRIYTHHNAKEAANRFYNRLPFRLPHEQQQELIDYLEEFLMQNCQPLELVVAQLPHEVQPHAANAIATDEDEQL